jgi:hypothetical protein
MVISVPRCALGLGRLVLPLVVSAGCASEPAPVRARGAALEPKGEVERLLPLEADTILSYETSSPDTGASGLLVIEVRRRSEGLVELRSAGRSQILQVDEHGVRHLGGGYLLRKPLVVGSEFRGEFGSVRITSTTLEVEVPAGRFSGCLQTVEETTTGASAQRSTKVFCPGAGIVFIEQQAMSGGDYLLERARLRSFGPRVDIYEN